MYGVILILGVPLASWILPKPAPALAFLPLWMLYWVLPTRVPGSITNCSPFSYLSSFLLLILLPQQHSSIPSHFYLHCPCSSSSFKISHAAVREHLQDTCMTVLLLCPHTL